METPPKDSRVVMPLPRPVTDVSWDKDIHIVPNYVKGLNLVLSAGIENITYTATHPISKLSVSCSFSITVIGKFFSFFFKNKTIIYLILHYVNVSNISLTLN